jgi:hypothetical protein
MSGSSQPPGLFDLPEHVLGQIITASKGIYRIHPLARVCRQGRDVVLRLAKRIRLAVGSDLTKKRAIAGLLSRARQLSRCAELMLTSHHTPDSFFAELVHSCKAWASVNTLYLEVGCLK